MARPSVPRTMMDLWRHADTRQSLYRAPRPGSKRRRIVLQQRPPHQLDRRETLLHEGVMEILEPKSSPFAGLQVGTQLEDLQLAERVVQVGRVRGTAFGLHLARVARLVALLDEEVARLLQRHLAGVQHDADDVARITQQRIAQLTQ